jgi:hypothetical protein
MFLALWLPKTLIIEHTSSKKYVYLWVVSSKKHDTRNKLTVEEHFAATLLSKRAARSLEKTHVKYFLLITPLTMAPC